MASSSSTKVSMKLLIDTKNNKVLFAEASKPVIDFLFNLLCLPIGTVVKLLSANDMVGSLGNLYQSVENLNQNYMQPFQTKHVLLNPKTQSPSTVTYDNTTPCPGRPGYPCGQSMIYEVCYVRSKKISEKKASNTINSGFVKDVVTFMVMDDLVIQPMSTISSITLLNKFNIKEIGTLQEKIVEMGMDEGIMLLKALQSKMVFSSRRNFVLQGEKIVGSFKKEC
ncbi:uncharacterized protein LOC131648535 [Vicia villosa]|uniref:uncharacterized protein LOC131648535 n=1 Tax=Vicia villosa TaxID=3911 RepID=UPI00273B0D17|nr:uncharacterized protein LOC131648535 [Vicia villosa]